MAQSPQGMPNIFGGSNRLGFFSVAPEDQHTWHTTYRDSMNNMYRTSYTDMSNGREVCVKSDLPSGYGGHQPSVRHDVLFRNTGFDEEVSDRRYDQNRDAFPSFRNQILGVPTSTQLPRGAKKVPTTGVIPHDGTTTMLKPPWGVLTTRNQPLNHRSTPRTMPQALATMTPRASTVAPVVPIMPPGSLTARGPRSNEGSRTNEAARLTGESVVGR